MPSESSIQQGPTSQIPLEQETPSKEAEALEPEQVPIIQEDSIDKDPIHKKAAKKVVKFSEPESSERSIEELREIEKTEREMYIQEREELCQVHKGPLTGLSYHCPTCKTKYCVKCATTLMNSGEGCWVCNTQIISPKLKTNLRRTNCTRFLVKKML